MSEKPIVSVIMPVFNAQEYLTRSLDSILDQTVTDWELLAVDDCSTDGSTKILADYASRDSRILHYKLEKNAGAAIARNMAIANSRGRFMAFLDADDQWMPMKLERQLSFMEQNSVAFSCTSYRKKRTSDNFICDCNVPKAVDRSQLLKNNIVGTSTVMLDTEKTGRILMPELRMRQDFGLWLLLLEKQKYVFGLDEILSIYHSYPNSISANKFKAASATWRLFRNHLKLPLPHAVLNFCFYAANSLTRNQYKNPKNTPE